jgi:hypothetical protein
VKERGGRRRATGETKSRTARASGQKVKREKNNEEIGAGSGRRGSMRRRRRRRRRRGMGNACILVCESNSPNVCYILPQGQFPINVPPVLLKGRIQVGHTLGRCLE